MARLTSWFSPQVMHALGWALIHSVWQCLALAALAAAFMAISRRPSIRYLIATGALVAMLAAPATTFLLLLKPAAPAQALVLPNLVSRFPTASAVIDPPNTRTMPPRATSTPATNGIAIALVDSQKHFLPPRFLSSNFLPANILSWLVAAWLCGVALFSLRFAGGFLLLEQKRRRQSRVPSPRILAQCRELQRQLGLNRAIRYLECGWLQAPAVIGWLRPVVLLPVTALTGLTEEQLRAVIAHELAHIRRHDFFVNLLQILVETLLFYHPAIWWLNRRIRAERELCCDEIAVSLTGDRLEYVRALILMEEWEQAPALAMAANRSPLSERIFHILDRKPFRAGQRMLGVTGSILFLAAALGAANALFGVALPIPAARAEARIKTVPSPNKIALNHAINHIAPPIPQPNTLAAKDAVSNQSSGNGATGQEMPQRHPTPTAAISHAEKLVAAGQVKKLLMPSPDLPRLLSAAAPETPVLVAMNDPPAAPAQPNSKTSPAMVAALNGQPGTSNAAQTTGAQIAPTQPTPARTCTLPKIADTAPLKPLPGTNLMAVPVAINGSTKKFLLDLGMKKPTAVSPELEAKLGLPENPKTQMRYFVGFGAMGNPIYADTPIYDPTSGLNSAVQFTHVHIGSFGIGGATGHHLLFQVTNRGEISRSAPYEGLLTGDFFRQYDVELDFAGKQMTWLTPTNCTDPDQVVFWSHTNVAVIPVTLAKDGRLQMQAMIQGHVINAEIDTSSEHTVMRRDIAELYVGLKADTQDMAPLGDLKDGLGMQIYVHNFPQITFAGGGVTALNVPVLIQNNSLIPAIYRGRVLGRARLKGAPIPDLAIGMDVLSQLHMYVVLGEGKIYVTSAK